LRALLCRSTQAPSQVIEGALHATVSSLHPAATINVSPPTIVLNFIFGPHPLFRRVRSPAADARPIARRSYKIVSVVMEMCFRNSRRRLSDIGIMSDADIVDGIGRAATAWRRSPDQRQ